MGALDDLISGNTKGYQSGGATSALDSLVAQGSNYNYTPPAPSVNGAPEESDYIKLQRAASRTIEDIRKQKSESSALDRLKGEGLMANSTARSATDQRTYDPFYVTKEQKNLDAAIDILSDFANTPEGQVDAWRDIGSSIRDALKSDKPLPFLGTINSVEDAVDQYKVAKKLEGGAKQEELSREEKAVFYKMQASQLPLQRSKAYAVTSILMQFPAFIGEFALTGGVYSGVAKGTAAGLTKGLITAGGEAAAEGALAKLGIKGLSAVIGGTAQSLTNIPRIAELATEYQTPSFKLAATDGDKISLELNKKGDSFSKALTKAIGANAVDYITERIGEGLTLSKGEAANVLEKTLLGKYMAKNQIISGGFSKFEKAISWNGIVNEVLEEEAAELLNAGIEQRDYKNPFTTPEGRSRLAVEAIGFGVIGLGMKAGEIATGVPAPVLGQTDPFAGDPQSAPVSKEQFIQGIVGTESGGDYGAIGNPNSKGQRAYGKHQVMDFNIPAWSKKYLGRTLTPQEYLADPAAQDKIAEARLGYYYDRSKGDVKDAASLWFSGGLYEQNKEKKDANGLTVREYVERVYKNAGVEMPTLAQAPATESGSKGEVMIINAPEEKRSSFVTTGNENIDEIQQLASASQPSYVIPQESRSSIEGITAALLKPSEAITDKTPGDFQQRWTESFTQFKEKVQQPLIDKIEVLQAQIEKADAKTPEGKNLRSGLKVEIAKTRTDLVNSRKEFEQEHSNFQVAIVDHAIKEAQASGVDLGKYTNPIDGISPQGQEFRDELLQRLYSTGEYKDQSFRQILDGMVMEFGGLSLLKDAPKEKVTSAPIEKSNVEVPAEVTEKEVPAAAPKANAPVIEPKTQEEVAQMPVKVEGEVKKSRAFERVRERLGILAEDSVNYNKLDLDTDTARALDFVENNPKEAKKIALGKMSAPEGVTETAISIAVAEQAAIAGDYALQAQVERSRSLRQTRRGQEIVAERGRFNENSAHFFIQQVLKAKMEIAASGGFKSVFKKGQSEGKAARGAARLETETAALKEIVKKKMSSIQSAQSVIDQLTC